MASARNTTLEVDAPVTEGGAGLRRRYVQRAWQVLESIHAFHSAAAPAADGLDQERQANLAGRRHRPLHRTYRSARHYRHACRFRGPASLQFVTHRFDLGGGRSDEHQALRLA